MARPSIESLLGDYIARHWQSAEGETRRHLRLFAESVRAHYDQAVELTEAEAELLLTRLGWTCTPPAAIAAPAGVDLAAGEFTQPAHGVAPDGGGQSPAPEAATADAAPALNTAEGAATVDTAAAPAAEGASAQNTAA